MRGCSVWGVKDMEKSSETWTDELRWRFMRQQEKGKEKE